MKGRSPAFQWYPKDYLSDGNVMAMNMTERGIYITLLSTCWIDGAIPADVHRLARICGMTFDEFLPCWQAVEPTFRRHPNDDSLLIHPRLQKELKKQADWRKKCSAGGVKSGQARRKAAQSKNYEPKGTSRVVEPDANKTPTLQSSSSTTLKSPNGDGGAQDAPADGVTDDIAFFTRRDGLMKYLETKLEGHALGNPKAEKAAALWLVRYSGFSDEQIIECLDVQWCESWRKKIGWLTVKPEIAAYFARKGQTKGASNGNSASERNEQNLRDTADLIGISFESVVSDHPKSAGLLPPASSKPH